MTLEHFPPNPDYGQGCFRRRVTIRDSGGATLATTDDTHHAMWVFFEHDQHRILHIEGGITRGPATTCHAAAAGLANLVGWPLAKRPARADSPPPANCTHLVDLAGWAINAAAGGVRATTYDVSVPDQDTTPVWVSVCRDGALVHKWMVYDLRILAPDIFEGRPLMRGFNDWARRAFEGNTLEAATILQRGVFVARGRTRLVDRAPPMPLKSAAGMAGACYSYSGDRLDTAHSVIGYVRDFTEGVTETPPPAEILTRFEGTVHEPA